MLNLNSSVSQLNKIGAVTAKRLKILGIETIEDLLFYFPMRYDDFSETILIKDLKEGVNANIKGTVELIQNKRSPKKRINITEALISDETESLKIIWFNQPFIAKNLKAGDLISLSGHVESDYTGLMMQSPEYEKINKDGNGLHTQGLVPIYHTTANLTQKQLRFLTSQITNLTSEINDFLPDETKKRQGLLSLSDAIQKIHFPKNTEEMDKAKSRLAFDELFIIQLQSQLIKKENQENIANSISFFEKDTKNFVDNLPFTLTDSQKKSAWEIIQDLEKEKPMMRMLEGDVGSGKTVVAALAMLNASKNKFQSILMAPTEILAKQHFESLKKLFTKKTIKIGLITQNDKKISGSTGKLKAEDVTKEANIIIGTHALIQKKINFKNLGLAIIDEQHRFGVKQRKELIKKAGKKSPHLLSMTATPIPRSLALTIYGDLDISIINELPKGRKKIITRLVDEAKRQLAYNFIKDQIKTGRQVFVVCPLIDESDKLGAKSVKQEYEKLNKIIFPDLKIEMLHGKLKPQEKEEIMRNFLDKKIDILVSTSVIEVGVDVSNASIMMIEGSERFGLAQLHQFRGRVGRSGYQSYCLLLSDNNSPQTTKRLEALVKYNSGFDLANIDLKLRGPGEVYGTNQKGFPDLKIANLFDHKIIKKARAEAELIVDKVVDYPKIEEKLKEFNDKTHLE